MNLKCILLSFGLYIIYICTTSVSDVLEVNWDGIVFSQVWPITACIHHKDEKSGSSCNIYPNMTSWTVHGLWPTKFGERGPNNCNSSWAFRETEIANLESLLVKYWTNIYADTPEDSLWQHEWSKHGTCAAELFLLNSEHKYFLKGLELVMEYDLVSILALKGIFPSDKISYDLKEIADAIIGFTDTNPFVDCIYNEKNKRHELWQIKICLNRQLSLMSCNDFLAVEQARGNCPEKGVFYPSSVVSGGRQFKYTNDLVYSHVGKFQKRTCKSGICQFLKVVLKSSLIPIPFT